MDVLLTDANVVTMAAGAGPAASMLVRDDRIAAAGPAEQVRAAAGDRQRHLSLAVPGRPRPPSGRDSTVVALTGAVAGLTGLRLWRAERWTCC